MLGGVFNVLILCWIASLAQAEPLSDAKALAENKMKLGKVLAKDYEKLVNPGNTTLKIGLSFVCAHYNLQEKRLYSRVFERYSWTDWRLKWDPSKYGGLDNLKVPSDMIWTPHDVRLYDAFPEKPERDDVNVIINSEGTVYWIPSVSYITLCGPGETLGDRKGHCHISLGTWTYSSVDLPLEYYGVGKNKGVDLGFYLDDCPHVMSNVTFYIKNSKYDCCPDTYASLEVDFDLEERSEFKPRGRQDRYHKKSRSERPRVEDCRWPNC